MTAIPASPPTPRSWTGPLMVLAGGVGIGFAPIGLRFGLDDLGPQAIAFWRYVFALPLLLALVFLIERRAPRLPNRFILMAGTFFTLDIALWHHALTLTTVSNATFIVNLGNVLVGFGAWFFLKQRPHAFWFVAAALAILGAAALSLGGGGEAAKAIFAATCSPSAPPSSSAATCSAPTLPGARLAASKRSSG
jgi:drug/metabolite transporter (DMT)-like permease